MPTSSTFETSYDRLLVYSIERGLFGPRLLFLTFTFLPTEEVKPAASSIPPAKCFEAVERWYVRFLSLVLPHCNRPSLRQLQPLTFVFLDYPGTKRKQGRATSDFEGPLQRVGQEFPEMTPHVHALMLIHPGLVERFERVQPRLESLFDSLDTINRTLHVCELTQPGDDERVLRYSSELLAKPQHPDLRDVDLFRWLPKARSEPTYQKWPYERELEQALVEDRVFRRQHRMGVI